MELLHNSFMSPSMPSVVTMLWYQFVTHPLWHNKIFSFPQGIESPKSYRGLAQASSSLFTSLWSWVRTTGQTNMASFRSSRLNTTRVSSLSTLQTPTQRSIKPKRASEYKIYVWVLSSWPHSVTPFLNRQGPYRPFAIREIAMHDFFLSHSNPWNSWSLPSFPPKGDPRL